MSCNLPLYLMFYFICNVLLYRDTAVVSEGNIMIYILLQIIFTDIIIGHLWFTRLKLKPWTKLSVLCVCLERSQAGSRQMQIWIRNWTSVCVWTVMKLSVTVIEPTWKLPNVWPNASLTSTASESVTSHVIWVRSEYTVCKQKTFTVNNCL